MTSQQPKVLYHPLIEPNLDWLKKMMLVTDQVVRICPHDLKDKDTAEFREFSDTLEGAVSTIEPNDFYVTVEPSEEARLDRIFQEIASTYSQPTSTEEILTTNEEGVIGLNNHLLLHRSKFSLQTAGLLRKYNLIRPEFRHFAEVIGHEGFDVVEERAANLIMSIMADKIAQHQSWDTITENTLNFTYTSLNAFENPTEKQVVGLVAECIIKIGMPDSLSLLTPKDYKNLRRSFQEIRSAYHQVTHDMASSRQWDSVTTVQEAQDYMVKVTADFTKTINAYRRTAFKKSLGKHTRAGFCHIATLTGDVGKSLDAAILDPSWKTAAVMGGWAVNFLSRWLLSQTPNESDKEKLLRMLCTLDNKVARRRRMQAVIQAIGGTVINVAENYDY